MPPLISVIVPVYNVMAYLEDCLDSVLRQTMQDFEVVMVDDGSTDDSVAIAERYAERDARFRLVRQANGGLGKARNTGLEHAVGTYVCFLDSDDLVPPRAYELLSGALESTGSDFATGNVRRLSSQGTRQARFLAPAFGRTRMKTHIRRFPALISDRTAWNKLFRRTFWDAHRFRFPEGVYYEDQYVTLPAHYLASSVDVISQPVYYWRIREDGALSITQRRSEPKAVHDRVVAVEYVSEFLAAQGLRAEKRRYDETAVTHDLRYFLDVVDLAGDDYRHLFLDLVNGYLDRTSDRIFDKLPAIKRLEWELVRRRALPELVTTLQFERHELDHTAPIRRGRRWYGDYPFRGDKRLGLPSRLYRLRSELKLVSRVSAISWTGTALRVEGHAYVNLLGAPSADAQKLSAVALPTGAARPMRLSVESVYRPELTATSAQEAADISWAGYVAELPIERLRRDGGWREGTWQIVLSARLGTTLRVAPMHEVAAPHPVRAVDLPGTGDKFQVRVELTPRGELMLRVEKRRAVLTAARVDDGVLQLEGDVGALTGSRFTLVVARAAGLRMEFPAHVDRAGGRRTFLARMPLAELTADAEVSEAVAGQRQRRVATWDLSLKGAGTARLTLHEELAEPAWSVGGLELLVQRNRGGQAMLVQRAPRPVITDAQWDDTGTELRLTGTFRAAAGDHRLQARNRRGQTIEAAFDHDAAAQTFTATVPATARGSWELVVSTGGSPDSVHLVVDHALLDRLPVSSSVGGRAVTLGVTGYDTAVLDVAPDLADDERGGYHQRRLRTDYYPARCRQPLRDLVLYESYDGLEASESPRAVFAELSRRELPAEHVWVVRDARFTPPDGASGVRAGSHDYYDAFARARYIVTNDHLPDWFERRDGQTVVQTWHGSPLKRIGTDLAVERRSRPERSGDEQGWTLLVSPGPFARPILSRALAFTGEIVESGNPRVDLLLRDDAASAARDLRRRFGVRDGAKAVLFAPTLRDHLTHRNGGFRLGPTPDLDRLRSELGDDHVVLFRRHPLVVDPVPDADGEFVIDVSAYPDVMDLLLVADVLVTDFSSLVFDFTALRRPVLIYAPDLDAFRDEGRGLYVDLAEQAPGPVLRDTEQLLDALRRLPEVEHGFRDRYDAFVRSYCPLDDGKAAGRLADRMLRDQ